MSRVSLIGLCGAGAFVLSLACATPAPTPAPTSQLPPPCSGDSTIYSRTDYGRGIIAPSLLQIGLPEPQGSHGSVVLQMLISPQGTVLSDSTRIVKSGGASADRRARAAAERSQYVPATHNGCAVSSWFTWTYNL